MPAVLVVPMAGGIPAGCAQQAADAVRRWAHRLAQDTERGDMGEPVGPWRQAVLAVRTQPGAWPCAWVAAAGTVQAGSGRPAQLTCWHAEDGDAWARVVDAVQHTHRRDEPLLVLNGQPFPRWAPHDAVVARCKHVAVPACLGWRRAGLLRVSE